MLRNTIKIVKGHRTLSSIPDYKFGTVSGFYPMQKPFLPLSMDAG